MIKKIESIKNLAVFKDFEWNKSVVNDNNILEFKNINILYGRNYSGKTTLSRIIRALEIGKISDKYENPKFTIEFSDNSKISESNLSDNKETIRVFNEDFVKENLLFISNPESDVESFAILGSNNNEIENEIKQIKDELGINEEGKDKTGLYREQEQKKQANDNAKANYQNAERELENQLSQKATGDRFIAIKYHADIYGDLNYNLTKLKADIESVSRSSFKPLNEDEKNKKMSLLKESTKDEIPRMPIIYCDFSDFVTKTKNLLERQIGKSEKIDELVKDAVLNKWVKEGNQLHKEKQRKTCAFCGNPINLSRWEELEKHFDERSAELEKEIESLITEVKTVSERIANGFIIDKNKFYSKYHSQIDLLINTINSTKEAAKKSFDSLISQLNSKQNILFDAISLNETDLKDFSEDIQSINTTYESLIKESNSYANHLKRDQDKARKELRLREVSDFVTTIKYSEKTSNIEKKKTDYETKKNALERIDVAIREKEDLIDQKRELMNDEEKGAIKVNEYLNDFFGHKYLSLRSVKQNDTGNHYKFEVIRDNKKAYHLSEGECSLVAFCYFMARLEDITTKGKKPIIWIDDPISSLDSNHIFFIYSLISTKIADTDSFEQLFVSTHNLNFLGYLKRMNGKFCKGDSDKTKQYFCIKRHFEESDISSMPLYLKEHITEFNYLFKEIYSCSLHETVDESNYQSFYNFGNNARKFLEIYLFYKFPDKTEERKKMESFFGADKVPVIFSERINNEYSHLKENVSRGFSTIDVPEMQKVAELIVKTIKEKDEEQYNALLNSINYK